MSQDNLYKPPAHNAKKNEKLTLLQKYSWWIVENPLAVLVATVCITLALATGVKNLVFTTDYRVFFSDENPELLAFEELQDAYTKSDNVLVMLQPKDGDVYTKQTLQAVAELTTQAWQLPLSIRVDSLTNYQNMVAEDDDLIVGDLVEDPEELNAELLTYIRKTALAQPTLVKKLVSPNGTATGVNIVFEMPSEPTDEERRLLKEVEFAEGECNLKDPIKASECVVADARGMLKDLRAKYPDIEFTSTGLVMMNQAFPEASFKDMKTLIPLAFGVITIGVLVLIASPGAMLGTVLVVFLSILAAMGTAGWMGIKLTPPSASAPLLIMTLAVADCVHFLVTLYHNLRGGMPKQNAVVESLRINAMPIFLTSVTTAIGFLSMNASDAPPFRDLGNITAVGVLFAFFLSMTFLPAFTAVFAGAGEARASRGSKLMDGFASFVIKQRKMLFIVMGVLMVGLASLAPLNELNDVFVEYFDESVPFRVETDKVTDNLSGLYSVEYSLDSGEEGGISNPGYLAKAEQFERYLESRPEVQHVSSYVETIRRLNRSMHGDDEAYYTLPESRELSAQYLLLYEFSLPYGLDLNNQINFDKTATRMTATLDTLSTKEMLEFEQEVKAWMDENTPSISTLGSGTTTMFSHIGKRNVISMLSGTFIALVLISLILIFALKSVKLGLISLIPNLAPALMSFGIWALMVGQVGLAVSVVFAMTLGIVVDDTIHFLSKYQRARREQNLNAEDAVRYAFNTVGVALFVTTVVLMGGFLVISQSNFSINSEMGLMTAITIVVALIVDFLFLPPLLLRLDGDKKEQHEVSPTQPPISPATA